MRFTRLKLAGFKSFIDGTDLVIEQGVTGIVGPNGCGKSNLVEALRWVMGESSAKQMRGDEMDDVIFSGTDNRPSRNIAEVQLLLDNRDRTAPPQFNDFEEIEVSRRIQRGSGSTFRVNGREVRARDVQLLFADVASGPRSTAMVSQGRIGNIISAKPTNRRVLLEEAAGITGLHSRRHEAEVRLRAADANLVRLEDVMGTMDGQLQALKKQARQASRYRNLNDHIRRAEATVLLLRWRTAGVRMAEAEAMLRATEVRVAELTAQAAAASTHQTEAAAALPGLRQTEAEAGAELQRLIVERDRLRDEEARIEAARRDCESRLAQIAADRQREESLAADADAAIERLEVESAAIDAAREGEADTRAGAEALVDEIQAAVEGLEVRLSEITAGIAADEARRAALSRAAEEAAERARRLSARAAEIAAQRAAIVAEAIDPKTVEAAVEAAETAEIDSETAHARVEAAAEARAAAAQAVQDAAPALREAESFAARLDAEEKGLVDLLESAEPGDWPPLIDALTVRPGYEAALAAALGDDLSAPLDEAAPVHWRALPPIIKGGLPAEAEPLADMVQAPPALARRLTHIGIVAEADGARLAPALSPGQRLVSREGGLWRWDGFTVRAGAQTTAAARLRQRNRLNEIREQRAAAIEAVEAAAARVTEAENAAQEAAAGERSARETAQAAERRLTETRAALARLREKAAEQALRLSALDESAETLEVDRQEALVRAEETQAALTEMADPAERREQAALLRAALAERRAEQVEARSALNGLVRQAEDRQARQRAIGGELESWRDRGDGARAHLAQLDERRATLIDEAERLAALPEELAAKRETLFELIESSEAKRRAAADRLAEGERIQAEADRTQRQIEGELGQARENRVRAEEAVNQSREATQGLVERIAERLNATPDRLLELSELADDAPPPSLDDTERKLERLLRERETMGPVNLRAETEATELEAQIEGLETERADLIKAIEKLRRGIAELNREGRQRLLASFEEVDGHFRALFTQLFGGGKAHLTLTESDDPLDAGLEIMASPPGKRLQVMSLLSGGEQALTALALMFAVFLTNPAPICVLDEVDAPLDDANVDRVCALIADLARQGKTQFLVITHHRLTMARMDRLFGVTMAERGISQLVSVDLGEAERLREIA